jgi:aminopeptidase N
MFYVFYRTVGPEKFRRIVGGFYQANAVKGASTDDFVAYAQGVAGAQLEPLFRDWIYTTAWWDVVREAGTVEQLVTRYSKATSSSFRH